MDGTIYLGERVLPGAPELLRLLEARGTAYYFFTNNSSLRRTTILQSLSGWGWESTKEKSIITSST
jgi:ribonucleotide monophosphatase NagD (HAD superfamily)